MPTKRRGQGEGSIYQRASDKMWIGAVHLGYQNGKRIRPTVSAKTYNECRDKLQALMRENYAGTLVARSSQTVTDFLNDWLETTIRPHKAWNTYESYRGAIKNYLIPYMGHVRLQELNAQQVQRAMAKMLKELPRPSVRYAFRVARIAGNTAVKWNLISRNPWTLVDLPRSRRKETQAWPTECARLFLEKVKSRKYEHFYTLILACALRKSEALALTWDDVDLDGGLLHIRRALQVVDGTVTRVPPKTEKSKRTIHLPQVARAALLAQREEQRLQRNLSQRWQDDDYVFTARYGTPLSEGYVSFVWNNFLQEVGLPAITIHGLRHTTATSLLEAGVAVNTVSEMLGHSSVLITLGIYAHVLGKMKQNIAGKIDEIYSVG